MGNNFRNLYKKLNSLNFKSRDMVTFNEVAAAIYEKKFQEELNENFEIWTRNNRELIVNSFEEFCDEHNCICQECTFGPFKGSFWIAKRQPAPRPSELYPFS